MVLYLLLSQDVINVSSMLFRDEDEVRREKEKQRNQEDNDVVFHVDFIACLFYFSSLGILILNESSFIFTLLKIRALLLQVDDEG